MKILRDFISEHTQCTTTQRLQTPSSCIQTTSRFLHRFVIFLRYLNTNGQRLIFKTHIIQQKKYNDHWTRRVEIERQTCHFFCLPDFA